jgi:hypothetical protein
MAEYIIQIKTDGHDDFVDYDKYGWKEHGNPFDNQVDAEKRAVEIMVELQTKKWKNPRCRVIVPAKVVLYLNNADLINN